MSAALRDPGTAIDTTRKCWDSIYRGGICRRGISWERDHAANYYPADPNLLECFLH